MLLWFQEVYLPHVHVGDDHIVRSHHGGAPGW